MTLMDKAIVERLLSLNQQFYTAFARHFSASRPLTDPALTSILPYLPPRARVLDVGCGNGRLAHLLDRERPGASYVGIDGVPALIATARADAEALTNVPAAFHVADIARLGWGGVLAARGDEGVGRFDCVVCLAVLHHLPGFGLRLQVMREMAALLGAGGRLIVSTWQFLDSERQRRKIVAWAEAGIEEWMLEPGDYLLDWKRGGRGLRYCHLVDEDKLARLAAGSGLRVCETFRAGGREGNLSLFGVLEQQGQA